MHRKASYLYGFLFLHLPWGSMGRCFFSVPVVWRLVGWLLGEGRKGQDKNFEVLFTLCKAFVSASE